jgi:hypothetical protein
VRIKIRILYLKVKKMQGSFYWEPLLPPGGAILLMFSGAKCEKGEEKKEKIGKRREDKNPGSI